MIASFSKFMTYIFDPAYSSKTEDFLPHFTQDSRPAAQSIPPQVLQSSTPVPTVPLSKQLPINSTKAKVHHTGVKALRYRYNTENDAEAAYQLYLCYLNGKKGCHKDDRLAEKWRLNAARLNHPKALKAKSLIQQEPGTVRKMNPKSLPPSSIPQAHSLSPSSPLPDTGQETPIPSTIQCLHTLSVRKLNIPIGEDYIPQDAEVAYQMYRCYLEGRDGITANFKTALYWLKKASSLNHLQAKKTYRMISYFNKDFYASPVFKYVIKNIVFIRPQEDKIKLLSSELLKRAQENHPHACFELYRYYSRELKDDKRMLDWLDKAADLGHPEALYEKGFMIANGMKYKLNEKLGEMFMAEAKRRGFVPP